MDPEPAKEGQQQQAGGQSWLSKMNSRPGSNGAPGPTLAGPLRECVWDPTSCLNKFVKKKKMNFLVVVVVVVHAINLIRIKGQ